MCCEQLQQRIQAEITPKRKKYGDVTLIHHLQRVKGTCHSRISALDHIGIQIREGFNPEPDPNRPADRAWINAQAEGEQALAMVIRNRQNMKRKR